MRLSWRENEVNTQKWSIGTTLNWLYNINKSLRSWRKMSVEKYAI